MTSVDSSLAKQALLSKLSRGLCICSKNVESSHIKTLTLRRDGGALTMTNHFKDPSASSNNGGNVEASLFGNPCNGKCCGKNVDARGIENLSTKCNIGINATSSMQEVLSDFLSDGGHLEIVSIKLPSPLKDEDHFMQWFEVHIKKIDQILARGDGQMLNAKKCQYMIKKLQEVVDLMLKMIHASKRVEEFNCILKDLHRIVVKVFLLVKECGSEDLLVGAVYQLENKESFQELLLELECCYNVTCAMFKKTKSKYVVMPLDFSGASYEDVEFDQVALKEMLENIEIVAKTSNESSKLRKYLLKRLKNLKEVQGGELDTMELANCGTFEKGKQLGATGGYGSVYESKWLGLPCATKVLHSDGDDCDEMIMANFRNEASILAGLNHPNLVKFLGMGVDDNGWPFLMMERMDKSVAGLMKEHIKGDGYNLPLDVAIDIIQQVASGMYYLHDMHVVHRDLKPDNVLWTMLDEGEQWHACNNAFGCVKLTDFGISKIEVGSESLEADNMGSNFYRAPETLKMHGGMKGSYFQADVYSFGIMCAELLHGKVEFEKPHHSLKDLYEKIEGGMCPKMPFICEELTTLIRQCCAFHPLERPTFCEIWKQIIHLKANFMIGGKKLWPPSYSYDKVNVIEQGVKLYGIDEKVKEVQVCLQGANSLGIVGMGGVGKSTIAQAILDAKESKKKFKIRCLHHIGRLQSDEECLQVLQNLAEKLDVGLKLKDLAHGKIELEKALKENNILLILDDVWDQYHLSNIIFEGNMSLNKNSTLVVCSRNWDVIKDHVEKRYDMQPLSNGDLCMKLFTTHCFGDGKSGIPRELYKVGVQIVEACNGLPLSLKVLGAFLRSKERLRSWERVLQRLKRGRSPQSGDDWRIFEVLKISFDGLEEMEKRMFLDICCFFLEDVYGKKFFINKECFKLLTHGESALIKTFESLIHRSLIEVYEGTLQMHDQLRDMGRNIVEWKGHAQASCIVGEAKYVGTRFWHPSFSKLKKMKKRNFDFRNIEGISCEILKDNISLKKHLNEGAYSKLRILLIQTSLKEVSFDFTKLTNLTTLSFCGDQLKKFPERLENLKLVRSLRFKSYTKLISLPNGITHMSSLTSLDLSGCSELLTIPKELGNLRSLTLLDLSGCSKLSTIPKELENLSFLTSLDLSGCSKLSIIPKELANLSSLTSFDLRKCFTLSTIPTELGNLISLTSLNLFRCFKLLTIPKELGNLSSLTSLDLSRCSMLSTISKELGNLSSLISLDLSDCCELSTISKELGNLSSLTSLNLSCCYNILTLPKEFGNLSSLRSLIMSCCWNLQTIPKEMGNLSSLTSLNLYKCSNLLSIPKELGNLTSLTSLNLSRCFKLSTIPKELGGLSSLTSFDLSYCRVLSMIPKKLKNLSSLISLNLSYCYNVLTLPKEFGNLSSLTSLDMSCCWNLGTIPKELGNLSSLKSLNLYRCSKLSRIPKELGNLTSLTSLDLSWCFELSTIPKELGNLSSLTSLNLFKCSKLTKIPKELEKLSSLTSFDLS